VVERVVVQLALLVEQDAQLLVGFERAVLRSVGVALGLLIETVVGAGAPLVTLAPPTGGSWRRRHGPGVMHLVTGSP